MVKPMSEQRLYKRFLVTELFKVKGSVTTPKEYLEECGDGAFPYVTTQSINNGVEGFFNYYTEQGGVLTIDSAVLGYCSYQEFNFTASDHVEVLIPKFKLTRNIAMYFVTLFNKEQFRYSYGRKSNQINIKKTQLVLPAKENGEPDFDYMENYITSLNISKPITKNAGIGIKLNISEWSKFKLKDLFTIKKGKRLTKEDQTEGMTPYIGAIDSNNGLSSYIGQSPIHKADTISLSYNGSVGEAFFQERDFWATDDVNVLYPKFSLNKYIALFICTILRAEKFRFFYGRKWTLDQMNETEIKLPCSQTGEPDWDYMENYIKSLPYGDCI